MTQHFSTVFILWRKLECVLRMSPAENGHQSFAQIAHSRPPTLEVISCEFQISVLSSARLRFGDMYLWYLRFQVHVFYVISFFSTTNMAKCVVSFHMSFFCQCEFVSWGWGCVFFNHYKVHTEQSCYLLNVHTSARSPQEALMQSQKTPTCVTACIWN